MGVEFALDDEAHRVDILATCRTSYKTGVEMEAMTACSVAALTIYDMCKAADKGIVIEQVRLKYKAGGKSGEWRNDSCRTSYKTGVEMEAMTACSVAALTIYDMCKAADKGIVIEQVRLKYKAGGKSGEWRND